MSKKGKDNTVGPWAKDKLNALREYLDFYTKVLKNQKHWCKGTIYIDAFAGSGRAKVRTSGKAAADAGLFEAFKPPNDRDAVEFLKGSPELR